MESIPLTDQEWIAFYVQREKANHPQRCNHYRTGYGICGKLAIREGMAVPHPGAHSYLPIPRNRTRQETDMTLSPKAIANELAELEAQEERILERKVYLQGQAERLERRPKEPKYVSAMVQFDVQFDAEGAVYKIGALKAAGAWYTTSKTHHGPKTWDQLLALVERDYSVRTYGRTAHVYIYDDKGVRHESW